MIKDTPLEKLSDKKLRESVSGDYSLVLSNRELELLWCDIRQSKSMDIALLEFNYIDLLLDAMLNKCYEVGVKKTYDQIEKIESIKRYIKTAIDTKAINKAQGEIINRLQEQCRLYEIKIRTLT